MMEVYRQKGSINAVAPVRTREYEKVSFCSAVDQLVTGTPSSEMFGAGAGGHLSCTSTV